MTAPDLGPWNTFNVTGIPPGDPAEVLAALDTGQLLWMRLNFTPEAKVTPALAELVDVASHIAVLERAAGLKPTVDPSPARIALDAAKAVAQERLWADETDATRADLAEVERLRSQLKPHP